MIKIALTGKMGAGKNTVADYLAENYNFALFAFADALKEYAHDLFGKPDAKDRDLYQWFGQTMRQRDPDVWVKQLDGYISMYFEFDSGENAVITDIRQPNEYEYCRKNGYYIIRVNCRDEIRVERMKERGDNFDLSALNHETESYVDTFDVDFEIDNSGRWIDMANQVDVIMREIKIRDQLREGAKR